MWNRIRNRADRIQPGAEPYQESSRPSAELYPESGGSYPTECETVSRIGRTVFDRVRNRILNRVGRIRPSAEPYPESGEPYPTKCGTVSGVSGIGRLYPTECGIVSGMSDRFHGIVGKSDRIREFPELRV
jgi:hypothetical protein